MTEQQLREIEARCEAATPGPWKEYQRLDGIPAVINDKERIFDTYRRDGQSSANAEFAACAREDIPFLLAELDRLTDGIPLDRLREICEAEREWRVVVLPKPLTVDDLETIKNIGCIVRNIEAAEAAMKGDSQ